MVRGSEMSDARVDELKRLLPQCLLADWVRLGSRLVRVLRDRHHADRHSALIDRLVERARASVALRQWRAENLPRPTYPVELPITAKKDEILQAIRTRQVVVVAGETGSGKTTQIPKVCLEAGLGIEAKIGCTQPRRVAALSISKRVAEELGVGWSREIGCKIRFDDRSSPETFVKFMTDGMLLAEMQGDPLLSEYNAIVLDEAHERSLNIDFLLGHLKTLLPKRADLKLVITSATIDTAAFSKAFDDAPVVEVSGRMYPVEVHYEPIAAEDEESGELTYIDAAVRATERIVDGGGSGDVLIFMPGERDIRETTDQLGARLGGAVEIVPLYGRLSSGDQQRVFGPPTGRRVVVSTNIAETSLTIPGIRYVIDSGLARMSRYNPRTRTRRLPIEPISRSSADQRKGRAGRVQAGVCIRLYAEDDFEKRSPFTQPEIQRANLAEVILRMKAFHLGDIETFPFLNPPTPAAIQAGYTLLHELGALDEQGHLTALGQDLARLPIDPTLGRMLLQAQREHATRELLIIASGLSIQDPRERPLDRQAAADAAHRKHLHAQSDFLTLLNIWNAVHDEWERMRTQNQRRRFCRDNFLSYIRMREWQDLHAQLHDALEELGRVRVNESNAEYEAVHRSILTGLLSHVARRIERNQYQATANRKVSLFPGSTLFERFEKPPKKMGGRGAPPPEAPAKKTRQPLWLVAGEIVETTQVYARTLAGIDPLWIVELAPHLCKVSHQNPRWASSSGRVLVEEITTLSGLEVRRRHVAYGNLQPEEATRIFVRAALVEERLFATAESEEEIEGPRSAGMRATRSEARAAGRSWQAAETARTAKLPPQYRFLEHNRAVRQKVEDWQTRVRRHEFGDLDEAMEGHYAEKLTKVSSRDELNRWLGEHGGPEALFIEEARLTGGKPLGIDTASFPDRMEVGGQSVPIRYAYAPGEEHDGVTVQVPFTLADVVSPAALEWSVPGLREAKAEELLRALPKSLRAQLLPIAPKAAEIAREFEPTGPSLLHDLARFIFRKYGIQVPATAWPADPLPAHLKARVELLADDSTSMGAARDLNELRQRLAAEKKAETSNRIAGGPAPAGLGSVMESPAWRRAASQWERCAITSWSFGDLPERVEVESGQGGVPVMGWPGLAVDGSGVHVRLHRTQASAREGNLAGFHRLLELALQKDLAWVRKDLRGLAKFGPHYAPLGTTDELEETAFGLIRRHLFPTQAPTPMTRAAFEAATKELQGRLGGWVPKLTDAVGAILELRSQVARRIGAGPVVAATPASASAKAAAPGAARVLKDFSQLGASPSGMGTGAMAKPAGQVANRVGPTPAELVALLPARFLDTVTFERLPHLVRYLKAMLVRAERATANAPRDRERAAQLVPYEKALKAMEAEPKSPARAAALADFRWMLEEYRVSLFAQELGTAFPVSPKRLDEALLRLRSGEAG
ncbi:MAG: ATP-dependent RNA helicase HrpA [Verrucomicrobiales bacterium]|nr:ATP-dependent RNA helicase HrpA [Verrucomicrobiales bacterium]